MERKQRVSTEDKHQKYRRKQKEELAAYKAFYSYVLETNPVIVSAFQEVYNARLHETDDPATAEKTYTRQSETESYKGLTEQLWALPATI